MPKVDKKRLGVGCLTITPQARKNINQVLSTGRVSYGPFLRQFERRFSRDHGCRFGVVVNSGTSALRIALACLKEAHGWKTGDEVLIPALTFVATANVVIDHGLKPVFVDVDQRTYNIDPKEIEKNITRRTRAIMVVHLFGQPAAMDALMKIARNHKLKVIEDSCETMYASYRGRRVGSFGDIACFSTYVAHLVVTGVGGLALTNNKRYAEILRSLANHGRDNIYISIDDDNGKKGQALKEVISKRYAFIRPGYSFRLTEFEGALGCAQLDIAGKILNSRRRNAAYLLNKLQLYTKYFQLPWHPTDVQHSFMMFPLVIRKGSGLDKAELTLFLENRGIETRDMLPLINQPFYRKMYKIRQPNYPIADWVNRFGFYIGCHQEMRRVELDYILKAFIDFLKQTRLR